ncbi:MAG TPA: hypothetical protein VGC90_02410 [Candidatus Limnocylindrales bacterium]
MSVGLRLVGQAAKRGVTHRIPAPDALVTDIEAWLRTEAEDEIDRLVRETSEAEPGFRVSLHPAAHDVQIRVAEGGLVTATATTAEVGPGYHTYLCHLLRRLGTELSIAWLPSSREDGIGDQTGSFESGRRADAERVLLGWLGETLQRACTARSRGVGQVHLVGAGDRYEFDGAIATALGPRSDAWLASAVADPRIAVDILPWWADATDARYLLNRALCLMWTDVRWRPPVDQAERALLERVLRMLRRAFPLDPSLPYPWREWKELLDLSASDADDPMVERVGAEAATAADEPLVGYRRRPMTVVHNGWSLVVPGSAVIRRTPDELWIGEGDRAITVAATETASESGPLSPEAFLTHVGGHLGTDVLRHRDGPIAGIARLEVDPSSAVSVAVLDGYSAITGSGAAIRIVIHDPGDWEWAIETWRSLRPI